MSIHYTATIIITETNEESLGTKDQYNRVIKPATPRKVSELGKITLRAESAEALDAKAKKAIGIITGISS